MQSTRFDLRFSSSFVVTAAAALLLPLLSLAGATSAQAAVPVVRNGSSAQTAAPSCWDIKQTDSAATSGTYWLQTPELETPAEFQCDMTTDGGGWVLVGRGREGWQGYYEGQGNSADLLGARTSFGTTQLGSTTIDGLMNGQEIKNLDDGIRLRRATNVAGTSWQESRFKLKNVKQWVWTFGAGHPLTSHTYQTTPDSWQSSNGGSSSDFGQDAAYRRVNTQVASAQNYTVGFAFGSSSRGTPDSNSFLWSSNTSLGYARPYTEVWLRPKLRQADVQFAAIGDGGTAAEENRARVSTYGMSQTWGVNGLATAYGGEGNVEVQAFTESNGVVYVGGNFRDIRRGSAGEQIDQPYLAAFDRDTGEPLRSFTPALNGQVKALATLPNGNVVAGGQFTRANGQAVTSIVALNRSTGATDTGFSVNLENRISGGTVLVRSLSRLGSSLFIGGALTHASGGESTTATYQRGAAEVSAVSGAPSTTWNPEFNGTVVSLDASAERLYAAGYFTTSQGNTAMKAAAVQRVPNAPLATPAWNPVWSASERSNYQQAIREVGDKVWVGGSEHSMFSFDTSSFDRTSSSVSNAGGDLQTISTGSGVVYGGCHCNNYNYQDATTWPGLSGWTQADKIGWIGAWDAETGDFIPEFNPVINSDKGAGSWSSLVDTNGTLWTGGDYKSVRTGQNSASWAGGFVRFAAIDTAAPAAPSAPVVVPQGTDQLQVTWPAVSGAARYEVLRDDRVVAVTEGTTATVDTAGGDRYFVRAVDAAGNRSASSTVGAPVDPTENPVVIEGGSEWAYRNTASAAPADWNASSFDDATWSRGAAVLGFGSTGLGTDIDAPSPTTNRAITDYFRKTVTVSNVAQIKKLTLSTWADDGVAVYVNGQEVGRKNLGTTSIAYNRYADVSVRTTAAKAEPLTIEVPDEAIADDQPITIAVEVHLNYRGTRDASFDLTANAEFYSASDPKPVAEPDEPQEPVRDPVVLDQGAAWTYRNTASAPAADWSSPSFDDGAWSEGPALLGWGSDAVATNLDSPAGSGSRAVTHYFRKTITLSDVDEIASLKLSTWADDGIVVYVNGEEVGRKNIGDVAVPYGRYADSAPRTASAKAAPLEIVIPGSALANGPLTIAAQVHLNYRATKDMSFDLSALATFE